MNKEWKVYFVRSGESEKSPVKIGFTSNLSQRMIDLQCANFNEIKCLFALPCESEQQARDLESFFHWKLKHCHVRGEWFDISDINVAGILKDFNHRKKSKYLNTVKKSKFNCPFKQIKELQEQVEEYQQRIGILESMFYGDY